MARGNVRSNIGVGGRGGMEVVDKLPGSADDGDIVQLHDVKCVYDGAASVWRPVLTDNWQVLEDFEDLQAWNFHSTSTAWTDSFGSNYWEATGDTAGESRRLYIPLRLPLGCMFELAISHHDPLPSSAFIGNEMRLAQDAAGTGAHLAAEYRLDQGGFYARFKGADSNDNQDFNYWDSPSASQNTKYEMTAGMYREQDNSLEDTSGRMFRYMYTTGGTQKQATADSASPVSTSKSLLFTIRQWANSSYSEEGHRFRLYSLRVKSIG